MRQTAARLGLLLAVTLVGWALHLSRQAPAVTATALPAVDHATRLEGGPELVGLPVFPGAEPAGHATLQQGDGWSLAQATLTTAAPVAEVRAWYQQALGAGATVQELPEGIIYRRVAAGAHDLVRLGPGEGGGTRLLLYRRVEGAAGR